MKQTANYQLNQWEQTDRIQMADFNADNSRVDQALAGLQAAVSAETAARQAAVSAEASARQSADAAEQAARQAALTALENKSRFTKLSEVSLSSNTTSWEISLSGIDWTQWDRVHLDIVLASGNSLSLFLNNTSSSSNNVLSLSGGSSGSLQRKPRLSLDVGFQADRQISGRFGSSAFLASGILSGLTQVIITGGTILAGSSVSIWGEK